MGEKVEKVYSNQVMLEVSNFDMTFTFAQRKGQSAVPNPEDIVAEVIMSPQHAKVLSKVLSQNIQNYEEIFGILNVEPEASAADRVTKLVERE